MLSETTDEYVIKVLAWTEKRLSFFNSLTYLVLIHFIGKSIEPSRATEIFTQHFISPISSKPSTFEDLEEKLNYEFIEMYSAYLRSLVLNPALNQIYQEKIKAEDLIEEILTYKRDMSIIKFSVKSLIELVFVCVRLKG